MTFQELGLIEPILAALQTEGYHTPTPIQQQAIPHLLQERDLLGCAQTGTGKTAAFAIPILQHLFAEKQAGTGPKTGKRPPIRALILTPTRELAIQIDESFGAYGRNTGLTHAVIFGGVGQKPQTDMLERGVDILTATPGRLLDLMQQGFVSLRDLRMFVLDEADRMLDMGFIHDVRKVIAKLPSQRQTLFFSATMPPEIQKLANSILNNPLKVEVTPVSSTAETVQQVVYFVEKKDKKTLLISLLQDTAIKSVLIFTRTKHGANKVAKDLTNAGIRAEAIHGNKSQSARQTALANFKSGKNRALVATDIAARGIDIDDLSHVLNFELPNVPETYVHRIGRTGRAGASGQAISFCDHEEREYLRDIEKLIGKKVPVATADLAAAHAAVKDLVKPDSPEDDRPARPQQRRGAERRPEPRQQPQPAERRQEARQQPQSSADNAGGVSRSKKRRDRRRRNQASGGSSENVQQQPLQARPEQRQRDERPARVEQQREPRRDDRPTARPEQRQQRDDRPARPEQRQPANRQERRQDNPRPQQQRPQQQRPQGQPVNAPKPARVEKKVSDWDELDNFNW